MSHHYKQEDIFIPKRIPKSEVKLGKTYLIHARNGGIGVACLEHGQLNYTLRREKFGNIFLFNETDWEECKNFGTAIPLRELEDLPPDNQNEWLDWLLTLEEKHRQEIKDNWEELLRPILKKKE